MVDPSTTWGRGEYALMAERLQPAAELAAELARVEAGVRVLDVACGTGNFAVAAARRGGDVTGLDAEPVLLELAAGRGEDRVTWRGSDLVPLEAETGGFDVVGSIFGAMYAADHEAAAMELVRVCAPGGRIVTTAWVPGSFMPAFGAAVAPFLSPPPPGSGPPSRWGEEASLREIFGSAGVEIQIARIEGVELRFADREEAADFMIETAGNVVAERPSLEQGGEWGRLRAAVEGLVAESAVSDSGGVAIELRYLLAVFASTPRG